MTVVDEPAFERSRSTSSLDGDRFKEVTAFAVRVIDAPDGYARWPDRAADPRRVGSVLRCFGLPDHID